MTRSCGNVKMNLYLRLTDGEYIYEEFYICDEFVVKILETSNQQPKKKIKIGLDGVFLHYLIKEIEVCNFYRKCFNSHWKHSLYLILKDTKCDLIDYLWNERVYYMVRERCELDHALSWLSTLGGAFSALGDYFPNCAETAGRISYHQLRLALKLKDPNIASRCRLYFSLSLIQKKYYKRAQMIIQSEYNCAKNMVVKDDKLMNMCKGIWAKLQYEYSIFKNLKINKCI